MRDISYLPPEVLRIIFDFLSDWDRLSASQVCKKWLHTVNCQRSLCDIEVKFSGEIDEAVKLFSSMTRRFECFIFDEVTISGTVLEFLKKYCSQFVSLAFFKCKINVDECRSKYQDKILHCDNLKELNLIDTDIFFLFAPFPNVTILRLYWFRLLPDCVLFQLIKLFCKLEVLSIDSKSICDDTEFMPCFVDENIIINNPLPKLFSFLGLKMLIHKNRATLRCINMAGFNLSKSEHAALTVSEIKGLKLRSIQFSQDLHPRFIKQFCENQFSLTSLNFSYWPRYIDDSVRVACECLPNLQELVIRRSPMMDKCIIEIFQLQHLVKLDLFSDEGISEHSYREAVSNLKTFKLKYLDLSHAQISDESLFELLEQNQNIRYLNVTNTSISNKTLNMISKNLRLLDCLILESCRNISDSGLTGEFEDSLTPTPLSNLKYLTELNLSHTPLITNKGCIEAIRFPNLKRLSLYDCFELNLNSDFKKELQKQNPSLRPFPKYSKWEFFKKKCRIKFTDKKL